MTEVLTGWGTARRGNAKNTTSHFYFYVWRFGWVFYLMGLTFTACAFFGGFFACLGRLGARISGLTAIGALVFHSVGAALMT